MVHPFKPQELGNRGCLFKFFDIHFLQLLRRLNLPILQFVHFLKGKHLLLSGRGGVYLSYGGIKDPLSSKQHNPKLILL